MLHAADVRAQRLAYVLGADRGRLELHEREPQQDSKAVVRVWVRVRVRVRVSLTPTLSLTLTLALALTLTLTLTPSPTLTRVHRGGADLRVTRPPASPDLHDHLRTSPLFERTPARPRWTIVRV